MMKRQKYVIYYGWLVADQVGQPNQIARLIAAAQPQILVAAFYTDLLGCTNLSPQVQELLHTAGVKILAYVPTYYGLREHNSVKSVVRHYLKQGVDGIFFDEVYHFRDKDHLDYYQTLYEMVKEAGQQVILNIGLSHTDPLIMEVTDILMVEHRWRDFYRQCCWRTNYAPERFMGNSSNEPGSYKSLGYLVDLVKAVGDTLEAWENGIGWHYSTDHYIHLPEWYKDYTRLVGSSKVVPSKAVS
ncbi:MAG: spherulation-specific family 4 protein [Chloroflexota bacterium]|nr:hypothetical protein [Chloroflexota bacterium]